MLRTRVIPCLQLLGDSLVKTVRFKDPAYIGDPINTVRIFNELEVDEICFLDIRATAEKREPSYELLQQISDECFCPLSYGGGIDSFEKAQSIFGIGFEKIIINTAAHHQSDLITKIAAQYGSQAVVAGIDVKKNMWGKQIVYINSGTDKQAMDAVNWAKQLEALGAGELLLTNIDREGTWQGMDIELIKKVADAVHIPVIAHGGAGNLAHIGDAVHKGHASAVAVGSMVVYQKQGMGVLVNFPDQQQLHNVLDKQNIPRS